MIHPKVDMFIAGMMSILFVLLLEDGSAEPWLVWSTGIYGALSLALGIFSEKH